MSLLKGLDRDDGGCEYSGSAAIQPRVTGTNRQKVERLCSLELWAAGTEEA